MGKRGRDKPKHVKIDASLVPKREKQPRATSDSSENLPPTWRFSIIDLEGPWSWTKVDWADVKARLGKFEAGTWGDIRRAQHGKSGGSNSHAVETTALCAEAQKRLRTLGHDDAATLFSLRLDGLHRVWGIKDQQCLRLLWWDPNHEVCPSKR